MKKICRLLLTIAAFSLHPDAHAQKTSFVDVAGLDPQLKPGDDFFRYVNGRWNDTARIAADQSGVGSYSFLNIPQKRLLQNILDSVSKTNNQTGGIAQKVGDFYASGMNTATINHRGYQPVKGILAEIDALTDRPSLLRFVAKEARSGNRLILSLGISPDNKNSKINIAHFYQGGIGLPDRDYYFKTDAPTLQVQQAYSQYISALFRLTGTGPAAAAKKAAVVYRIEKQLAASHKTNVALRDVDANYHKMAVAAISRAQTQPGLGDLTCGLRRNNRFYRRGPTRLL
jgi:putative endopeptidase